MLHKRLLLIFAFLFPFLINAQDSTAYSWEISSKKTGEGVYELSFSTKANPALCNCMARMR